VQCSAVHNAFAIAHCYFCVMLRSEQFIENQIYWKNWKLSSVTMISKLTVVRDWQCSAKLRKLVAVGRKRHKQLTHACCLSFAMRSTLSAVRTVSGLPLSVLRFVADPVTVHSDIYISILLSITSTIFINLAIIVRNVTSRNNKDV